MSKIGGINSVFNRRDEEIKFGNDNDSITPLPKCSSVFWTSAVLNFRLCQVFYNGIWSFLFYQYHCIVTICYRQIFFTSANCLTVPCFK